MALNLHAAPTSMKDGEMSDGANSKAWQKFLTELGHEVTFAEIQYADENTRAELLQSFMTLTTIERAQISSTWAKMQAHAVQARQTDPTTALTTHFTDQARKDSEPWRKKWASLQQILTSYKSITTATLKQMYVDRAKMGQIPGDASLILHMLLYGTPDLHHAIAATLLHTGGVDALQLINAALAGTHTDQSFVEQFGGKILLLTEPILPTTSEFSAQNLQQITRVSGAGGAGGTASLSWSHQKKQISGAGYIPVVPIDGALAADTSSIETFVIPKLTKLEKQVATLTRRITQPTDTSATTHGKICFTCGSEGHISRDCPGGRGGARGGRGGSRGARGGARGRGMLYGRGEEDTEQVEGEE